MNRPNWTTLGQVAVIAIVVLFFALLAKLITAPHTVQGHYLQSGHGTVCVMQSVDWDTDVPAFCTDDVSKALNVMRELNASVGRH